MYRIHRGRYGVYRENYWKNCDEAATLEEALEILKTAAETSKHFYREIDGYDVPWHVAIEYVPDSQDEA